MPTTTRRLAQVAALVALIPLYAGLAAWSAARAAFARRRRVAEMEEVYVVAPYPPGERSGGSKAIAELLATLERGYRVHVVPLHQVRPEVGRLGRLLADWLSHALPMAVHARPFIVAPGAVRARMAGPHPVVIEFFSAAVFLCLGRRPPNPLVLREHEPPCRRLSMEARAARGLERLVLWLRTAVAWMMGAVVYGEVDRVVALTPEDAAYVRRAFPFAAPKVVEIPVSFDLPPLPPAPAPADGGEGARELLFVGNFHHRPNVDALHWFLAECAPRLGPGWTLHLCGLDGPLDGVALPESPVRVVRHGFVGDVGERFAHVRIAVAPVVSGAGVRMKNLFLASLGKAVVTTPLGNEGIGFVPGDEAVVTEDGGEMARALVRLAADPRAAAEMGRRAHERVRVGFTRDAVLARYRAEVFAPLVRPRAPAPLPDRDPDPVPARS